MNLTGQPIYQKGQDKPKKRKPLPRVSKRRADYRKSEAGKLGSAYMALAATLPCVQCGATIGKRDLHHCKDKPPLGQDGPYQKSPHRFSRSGDFDVIPLCEFDCHKGGPNSYHKAPKEWAKRNGPDYGFILPTRALVAAMGGTIEF